MIKKSVGVCFNTFIKNNYGKFRKVKKNIIEIDEKIMSSLSLMKNDG